MALVTHTVTVTGVRGQLGLWSRDDEPETPAVVVADVPVAIVGLGKGTAGQRLNEATEGAADQFKMVGPYNMDLIRFDTVTTNEDETYTVENVWRRRSISGQRDHTVAGIRLTRGTG